MKLAVIILRSLRQHALSTVITAASVALAGGLLMTVWAVKDQSQATFAHVNGGFDAVLGARGSKLQLVLNAVFHLEASPGNIAYSDFAEIQSNRNVELAIPLAMGDNYRGYRIVGTTPELFEPAKFALEAGGRVFDPMRREAVVGSFAAQKLKLKLGDTFHPYHGLIYDEKNQHAETYVVVGVLKPSNTPGDRVIWIPLEGVENMSGHDASAATELSAVLVRLKAGSAMGGFQLDQQYNKKGERLTFAWPIGTIVSGLFDKISWFDRVLALVAWLVAAIAAGSILASIHNSMNERRRELAILRALGARRRTIFSAIILEAMSISALGMAAGFVIYAALMTIIAQIIRAQTGVVLRPYSFEPVMIWAPLALIVLGGLAGLIPAFKAYRTDVAQNLGPLS